MATDSIRFNGESVSSVSTSTCDFCKYDSSSLTLVLSSSLTFGWSTVDKDDDDDDDDRARSLQSTTWKDPISQITSIKPYQSNYIN